MHLHILLHISVVTVIICRICIHVCNIIHEKITKSCDCSCQITLKYLIYWGRLKNPPKQSLASLKNAENIRGSESGNDVRRRTQLRRMETQKGSVFGQLHSSCLSDTSLLIRQLFAHLSPSECLSVQSSQLWTDIRDKQKNHTGDTGVDITDSLPCYFVIWFLDKTMSIFYDNLTDDWMTVLY